MVYDMSRRKANKLSSIRGGRMVPSRSETAGSMVGKVSKRRTPQANQRITSSIGRPTRGVNRYRRGIR